MLPVIYQGHGFAIQSYPFFMGLSVAFFLNGFFGLNKKKHFFKNKFECLLLAFSLVLISFLGARVLFQIVDGNLISFLKNPESLLNGGGLVFFGGYISSFLFLYIYSLIRGINKKIFSSLVPTVVFSHAIGRLGCFFSGCCFGDFCPLDFLERWPTQLIESVFLMGMGVFFTRQNKLNKQNIFFKYVFFYSSFRFVIEFLRGDKQRGLWSFGLSTSQIISLILIILFLVIYLKDNFSTKSSET